MTKTSRSSAEESILAEARDLIVGPRNDGYGPAEEDFGAVADMMNAYGRRRYGARWCDIDAEDAIVQMIFVKIGRQAHRPKRDNWADAIGYAALGYRVSELGGKYDAAEPAAV